MSGASKPRILAYRIQDGEGRITCSMPQMSMHYLERTCKLKSIVPLMGLFGKAHRPAKEITESYAAKHLLRNILRTHPGIEVVHVGDGAHARTGAMFAMTTSADNVSVDPQTNLSVVHAWQNRWNIQRFHAVASRVEDYKFSDKPKLLTFVHAHVNTDEVLSQAKNWIAAYVLTCCHPSQQMSTKYIVDDQGEDWRILSPQRNYQVILNPDYTQVHETQVV